MPALPKAPGAQRYAVERDARTRAVRAWVLRAGQVRVPLPHVAVHSPTGLEIGYGGSGPADLALSILADLFRLPRAASAWRQPRGLAAEIWCLHHPFKARWLAAALAPGQSLELDAAALYAWALAARERLRVGVAAEGAAS